MFALRATKRLRLSHSYASTFPFERIVNPSGVRISQIGAEKPTPGTISRTPTGRSLLDAHNEQGDVVGEIRASCHPCDDGVAELFGVPAPSGGGELCECRDPFLHGSIPPFDQAVCVQDQDISW